MIIRKTRKRVERLEEQVRKLQEQKPTRVLTDEELKRRGSDRA